MSATAEDTSIKANEATVADGAAASAAAAAVDTTVPAAAAASVPAAAAAPVPAAPSTHEAKRFLEGHKEKLQMNQYWYSVPTIAAMVAECEREGKRAAFLSTPSIFFSLNDKQLQANSKVFDYDEMWSSHPGFVKYDFKKPDEIPSALHGTFDFIVVDPPFITAEVWSEYAKACRLLLVSGTEERELPTALAEQYYAAQQRAYTAAQASLRGEASGTSFAENIASMLGSVFGGGAAKSSAAAATAPVAPRPGSAEGLSVVTVPRGKLLLSTIPEHEGYLHALLGVAAARFRPSIPNLIYQYSLYANYPSAPLAQLNPEIDEEELPRHTSRKKNLVIGN